MSRAARYPLTTIMLPRSRRYVYAPVAGGSGWNAWLPVKECIAMELSAACSGERPKLCTVGESRFKGSTALFMARGALPGKPRRSLR
jgi:hypothetical protein